MQSSRLRSELTCPVCQQLFTQPLLLHCGHTVCSRCANKLWFSINNSKRASLTRSNGEDAVSEADSGVVLLCGSDGNGNQTHTPPSCQSISLNHPAASLVRDPCPRCSTVPKLPWDMVGERSCTIQQAQDWWPRNVALERLCQRLRLTTVDVNSAPNTNGECLDSPTIPQPPTRTTPLQRSCQFCDPTSLQTASTILSYCQQCQLYYCSCCLSKWHPASDPSGRHQIVHAQESTPLVMNSKTAHCPVHVHIPCNLYCTNCSTLVCTQCLRDPVTMSMDRGSSIDNPSGLNPRSGGWNTLHSKHDGHVICAASTQAKRFKADLTKRLQGLSMHAKRGGELVQELKSAEARTKQSLTCMECSVNREMDQVIAQFEHQRTQLLQRLRSQMENRGRQFREQANQAGGRLASTTGLLQLSVQLLKETDPVSFVQISPSLQERIRSSESLFNQDMAASCFAQTHGEVEFRLDTGKLCDQIEQLQLQEFHAPVTPSITTTHCLVDGNALHLVWSSATCPSRSETNFSIQQKLPQTSSQSIFHMDSVSNNDIAGTFASTSSIQSQCKTASDFHALDTEVSPMRSDYGASNRVQIPLPASVSAYVLSERGQSESTRNNRRPTDCSFSSATARNSLVPSESITEMHPSRSLCPLKPWQINGDTTSTASTCLRQTTVDRVAYHLEVDNGRGGSFKTAYSGSEFACRLEGLQFNTPYRLRMRASNSVGYSAYSDICTLRTARLARFRLDPMNMAKSDKMMLPGLLHVDSSGSMVMANGDGEDRVLLASVSFSHGVHYWEWRVEAYDGRGQPAFGIALSTVARDQMLGMDRSGWSMYMNPHRSWFLHAGQHRDRTDGGIEITSTSNNSTDSNRNKQHTTGRQTIIGVRLDCDRGHLGFYLNGKPHGPMAFNNLHALSHSPDTDSLGSTNGTDRGGGGGARSKFTLFHPAISLNFKCRLRLITGLEVPSESETSSDESSQGEYDVSIDSLPANVSDSVSSLSAPSQTVTDALSRSSSMGGAGELSRPTTGERQRMDSVRQCCLGQQPVTLKSTCEHVRRIFQNPRTCQDLPLCWSIRSTIPYCKVERHYSRGYETEISTETICKGECFGEVEGITGARHTNLVYKTNLEMETSKRGINAQHRIEWFLDLKPCDFRRKLIKRYLKNIRRHSKNSKDSIRVKFLASKPSHETVSVLTQFSGSTLDVVRTCIQDLEMVEILDSHEPFDVVWCGTSEIPNVDLENRFVNKFPGAASILAKISLFRGLEQQRRLLPSAYRFYPQTWFMPFQKQAITLHSNMACSTKSDGSHEPRHTYIVKPDSGTQGRGIYLLQSPQTYMHRAPVASGSTSFMSGLLDPDGITATASTSSSVAASAAAAAGGGGNGGSASGGTKNTYNLTRTIPGQFSDIDPTECRTYNLNGLQPALDVVQLYEADPVLLNGCKTDLRVYVVIEALSPLRIHVYRDGLVRSASRLYRRPDKKNLDKFTMHLTNYAINKLQNPPKHNDEVTSAESGKTDAVVGVGGRRNSKAPPVSSTSDTQSSTSKPNRRWYCKRSLRELLQQQQPDHQAVEGKSKLDSWRHMDGERLWSEIDDIIRMTVLSLVPYFKVSYWAEYGHPAGNHDQERRFNSSTAAMFQSTDDSSSQKTPDCFQILGFDFLLVKPDNRPVLLEVNSNPSLRIDALHRILDRPSHLAAMHDPTTSSNRQSVGKITTTPPIVTVGPAAEAAAVLSGVLGDRYAEFERSIVDEQVKGGLIQSTLSLISEHVLRKRAYQVEPCFQSRIREPPCLQTNSSGRMRCTPRLQLPALARNQPNPTVFFPSIRGVPSDTSSPSHLIDHSLGSRDSKPMFYTPPCSGMLNERMGKLSKSKSASGHHRSVPRGVNIGGQWSTYSFRDRNTNALRSISRSKLPRLGTQNDRRTPSGAKPPLSTTTVRPRLPLKRSRKLDAIPRTCSTGMVNCSGRGTSIALDPAVKPDGGVPPMLSRRLVTDTGPCGSNTLQSFESYDLSGMMPGLSKKSVNWTGALPSSVKEGMNGQNMLTDIQDRASYDQSGYAPLECIYTEGDGLPENLTVKNSELCMDQYEKLIDKLNSISARSIVDSSAPRRRYPVAFALNLDAFDSPLRVFDLLADMFLGVLTTRKTRLTKLLPPKDPDQVTDDWTSGANADLRTNHLQFQHGNRSLFIPRMDLTAFRTFCRRCRIDRLGLSYTELDLIFAKQRNWWQRVYEPDLMKQGRELCFLRGLSFAAFVDLCIQLADHCCSVDPGGVRSIPATIHLPEIPLFPKPMDRNPTLLANTSTSESGDNSPLQTAITANPTRDNDHVGKENIDTSDVESNFSSGSLTSPAFPSCRNAHRSTHPSILLPVLSPTVQHGLHVPTVVRSKSHHRVPTTVAAAAAPVSRFLPSPTIGPHVGVGGATIRPTSSLANVLRFIEQCCCGRQ